MGRKIVITIGRNFGSNGRIIGKNLAKEMGIGFYDRNLIEMASKNSGVEWKVAGNADEKLIGHFLKFNLGLEMQENENDRIYRAQEEVIRSIVKSEESCVIVGRGADYILRNRPEVLKVFIYAPFRLRVETVMERYHFDKEEEAEKVVRHMDKTRRNYYEYFTDSNWDQKEGKDLLIDSSEFGIEGSVNLIKMAAECKIKRDWDDL